MNNTSQYLEKGKIPPQAVDLEEAVLGAMLIDKKSIDTVLVMLNANTFYDSRHKLIFEAIKSLYLNENQVDILTLSHELKQTSNLDKAGGDFYIIRLTQKVASSAHIEFHARIILQKYIQREMIKIASEIIEEAYMEETDSLKLLEKAYSKINKISETNVKPAERKLGEILEEVVEDGIKIANNEITPGIITPITKITSNMGGWSKSELIILAARPGMGKTAFSLGCALEPAKKGIPVAFFSLEMSEKQLTSRLASMEFKIDNEKFKKTGLQEQDLVRINSTLDKIPFYIDDTPNISIEHFQIKANQMKSKYGIELIIVDYIQLMNSTSSGKGNRENEVSKISRGLKLIAKELDIPVIALSQLSRSVETRGGSKRPQLSDLRESGAIEQDADVVGFLFRPEYYGQTEWDDDSRTPCAGQGEYICAKNRNGSVFKTKMKWEGRFTKFSDLDSFSNDISEIDASVIPTMEPEAAFDLEENKPDDLPF